MKTHNNPDRFAVDPSPEQRYLQIRTKKTEPQPTRLELLEQIKHYFEKGDYKKMERCQKLIGRLKNKI